MPIAFNMIPLTNATGCTLQLEDWRCGGEALGPGAATVVNCTSVGVLEVNTGTIYTWVNQATISPPSFCAFTACTPNIVTMTIWTPGKAAGKLAKSKSFSATATGQGGKPSTKPRTNQGAAGKDTKKKKPK